MRIRYRLEQFWFALFARPSPQELKQAERILTPSLMSVFTSMQPSEQAHSLRVLKQLIGAGHTQPDLLAAALLHDAGKSIHPLSIWERVLIVLGKTLFPRRAKAWGAGEPQGWRRAFVVAEQHPQWGAELAEQAGALPQTTTLIRRHQEQPKPWSSDPSGRLLRILQEFDDAE